MSVSEDLTTTTALSSTPAPAPDIDVVDACARFFNKPHAFVHFAFPWGQPNTWLYDEKGPDHWQTEVLLTMEDCLERGMDPGEATRRAIRIAVKSGHGVGKFLSNSIHLDTPLGVKRWGDLRPGDLVFGRDGRPTRVLMTHPQGVKPMYRITFDDGSSTLAGLEHLWAVRGRQERRRNRPGWRVMSTEDILEIGVKRKNGVAMARQWEIPIQGEAQFEEREIDLHPYFVGIWLGDGSVGSSQYTKPAPELVGRLRGLGYEVTERSDGKTKYLPGIKHLMTDPVFLCRSHERYIPDDYKHNSVENRKELLRGLLDTDGEAHSQSGTIGYASTSKRLAEDVIWLVRSLGGKAMMQPTVKKAWYPDEDGNRVQCRDCYRVTINLPWNPFTIEHRKAAYKPSEARYLKRWIDSIEYSHDEEAMCITVEAEDSLYIANDFIVTHNTALVAWIIIWFMATRPHPQVVVTANTSAQLSGKTWRELKKWSDLSIVRDLFQWTATGYYMKHAPGTWRANAVPWSKERSEAFAGTHERFVLIIFDEASAIEDIIYEVAEGAMTTEGAMWICFGNPTRNEGYFRDFWRKRFAGRWKLLTVDSRTAKKANQVEIKDWAKYYGEDSDFFRIRVLGQFPRVASNQFIGEELVERAAARVVDPLEYKHAPRILGVDVAYFGDDRSVAVLRQGNVLHDVWKLPEVSTTQLAHHLMHLEREFRETGEPIDKVILERVGIGVGTYDLMIDHGFKPYGVVPQQRARDERHFMNLRAEMWDNMKRWLVDGGCPAINGVLDEELRVDLITPEYGYDRRGRVQLERVEDIKARGKPSPDFATALALTHAVPVSTYDRPAHMRADDKTVAEKLREAHYGNRSRHWMAR